MFQVRIVTVDHYMSTPIPGLDISYSEFRKSAIKQVPVIRIFGTTPTGEKTCVHVHGVFPYICIPYDGSEPHLKLSYQLAASLDKAINIASGYSSSNIQHVYKVVLVSGVPFHGYHRNKHQYLKVYFYKPSVVKQAVSLLQNGAIMNKVYQPHEAHISFILQFFIDFNLYGMSFIDFCSVNYRQTNFPELLAKLPHDSFVPETIPAMSCSQYEVDVAAADISNCPSSQGNGQLNNPGIGAIWEDERRRRSMTPGTPLPIPQLHSQRPPLKPTASEIFFLRRLEGIINSASQEDNSGEPVSNKSYAMEEPTNNPALDASFVSLHATEVYPQQPIVDTIVNEDLALQNSPSSQRLLDKSLALDHDDFELLDVLEALAVTGPAAVDDDSVLGSQTVRANPADEDTSDDSGEDEKWQDRTIVPEEDNVLQLFDLSLPNIDENPALYNLIHEPQPGPSGLQHNNVESKIPQVDGTSDCPKKPGAPRRKKRIPQVDGLSDLKKNPGRKSLGMRGGLSHASKASTSREKYRPGGGLIFQTRKTVDQSTAAAPELIEPTQSVLSFPNIISSLEVGRADVDTHSLPPNTPLGSGNPIQTEPSEVANFSQSTVQNTLDQEDLAGLLPFSEVFIGPSSIVNSEPPGEEIIPYFPVDVPLQTSAGCKDCGGDGHGAINDDQTNLASSTIVEKADSFHGSTRLSKENKLEVSSIPSCKPSEVAGYVSSVRPSADLEDSKPTGIPNTMYGEISKSLARGPSNNDASCSDSKMNCLSEALENDPMEDILPTGSEEFSSQPATSRREELLAFVDKQKEIEEQTETDPVTDAPRQRYSKSPCNLCYTPHKASARKPTKNKKRKAKPFNFRMLCSVQLVKLTLANLYDVCQEHQVVYIGRNF